MADKDKMFDAWDIKHEPDFGDKRIKGFDFHEYNKLKLTKSAQQKLSDSINTKPGIYLLEDEKYMNNSFFSRSLFEEYFLLIPSVIFQKRKKFQDKFRKWVNESVNFDENKIMISKIYNFKETIRMPSICKSMIRNCFKEVEFCPSELELVKPNPFFIEIPCVTVNYSSNTLLKQEKWDSENKNLDIKEVLFEDLKMSATKRRFCLNDDILSIPKTFFVSDYLQPEIFLSSFKDYDNKNVKYLDHSKWKFKKKHQWVIQQEIIRNILDEPIHQIEIKYKVEVANITVELTYSQKLNDFIKLSLNRKWNFSEYKTYMMNWKPFGAISLENTLDENITQSDVNIPILSKTEEENYIKMCDLTKNLTFKPIKTYVNFLVGTKSKSEENDFPNVTNNANDQKTLSMTNRGCCFFNKEEKVQQYETSNNISVGDSPQTSSQKINICEAGVVSSSTKDNTAKYGNKETMNISQKRTFSQLDSIILKKKKKTGMAKFDFGKKYPYLDILNQSTFNNVSPKLASNTADTTIDDNSKTNVLEVSELNLDNEDELQILEISELKVCNVMINVEFAAKFGAAFNKFSNIIDNATNIILNEFEIPNYDLKFDMFLNPTSGVLFFRPINIYQIDLHTGDNLVLRQISEISYHVLSLIIVITIDDNIDIELDVKLKEFMELVESYGIQLFVINNDPKTISMSIFELIQKYSIIENDEPFMWTPEHRFLENCGIINPFLSDCILSKYKLQDFVNLPIDKRTGFLLRFCTAELINHINKAVQFFTEME